jgi:uncharacterized membrane protein
MLQSILSPVRNILAGLGAQSKLRRLFYMNKNLQFIVQAAVIAAAYTALTMLFAPISFGHAIFQFRVSEALTILPAITSASIPGLFIGCLVSNLLGGFGPIDIIFGSLATLIAAILSRKLKNAPWLVPLPPVIINALIVGSYLKFLYLQDVPLAASVGWVAIGQFLACYFVGYPLLIVLRKRFGGNQAEKQY